MGFRASFCISIPTEVQNYTFRKRRVRVFKASGLELVDLGIFKADLGLSYIRVQVGFHELVVLLEDGVAVTKAALILQPQNLRPSQAKTAQSPKPTWLRRPELTFWVSPASQD